jgi:hypothetical protein
MCIVNGTTGSNDRKGLVYYVSVWVWRKEEAEHVGALMVRMRGRQEWGLVLRERS